MENPCFQQTPCNATISVFLVIEFCNDFMFKVLCSSFLVIVAHFALCNFQNKNTITVDCSLFIWPWNKGLNLMTCITGMMVIVTMAEHSGRDCTCNSLYCFSLVSQIYVFFFICPKFFPSVDIICSLAGPAVRR